MERPGKRKSSEIEKVAPQFFTYTSEIKRINLPKDTLTHLLVDSSVTEIPDYAFFDCHALLHVQFSETLTRIGLSSFWGCGSIEALHVPEPVSSIGGWAFVGCSALKHITLPPTLERIEAFTFKGCSQLTTVDLPHGLLQIGQAAFSGCWSIETLHVPETVSSIGGWAFQDCSGLRHITLPPTLERIETSTFKGCGQLECIDIPSSVSSIGCDAFSECSSLSHIRIPPSVKTIRPSAVEGCSNLISIELPEESSFDAAFSGCPSLVNVAIPLLRRNDWAAFFRRSKLGRVVDDNADLLVHKLKHRFDNSPLNKLCYYQSYHSSEDAMAQRRSLMENDPVAATNQRDEFGMTPLHVISLSQTPNLDMLLAVMKGSHLDHIIQSRDSFGSPPMDYLCLNRTPNSTHVIRRVLQTRFDYLLGSEGSLKSDAMRQAIDEALTVELSCRREEIGKVYFKLAGSERKEILSLLELFLWKMQIFEVSSQEEHVDRLWCRVKSGACFVIPHVLPFLGRLDHVPSFPNQPG
eukprot:scaffold571_cov163-Cylindrotheca_fusiformis.AAC.1